MTKPQFFSIPELPQDHFTFNEINFYLTLDRHERIREWNYHNSLGVNTELENYGGQVIGQKIQDAFKLSHNFTGAGIAIYWQLGRLLGYWPTTFKQECVICRCFGVGEAQLSELIKNSPMTSALALRKLTKAGAGCGQCLVDVEAMVQSHNDRHGIDLGAKTKPAGLNPLSFLIKMSEVWNKWCEQNGHHSKLQFKGVNGYHILAAWEDREQEFVDRFKEDSKHKIEINFVFERVS